ncbi:MAG: hypothetical protein AAF702_18995 [Chloroflexota bacterium]
MSNSSQTKEALPFDLFAGFERIPNINPIFYCEPPEWAAAAHAVVVGDTIHYLWARRREDNYWMLMHSTAPASDPAAVTHDSRNPILLPSEQDGFDDFTVEYPFPFLNPADGNFYAYYLGRRKRPPKQTGLLVSDGDLGQWTRVTNEPVIPVEFPFEEKGSSHPSVVVDDETIHILYTGESTGPPVLCHATAPTNDPANVTKNPANPIFRGSGQAWDSHGVREAEIFKGPQYFHILYGGSDGSPTGVYKEHWQIGHIRTRDFITFEPNPHNPIFTPSADSNEWDCDGLLTPQVFETVNGYYMLYAGLREREWQSGLAKVSKDR